MKLLGSMHVILIMMAVLSGTGGAQLTASQSLMPPSAEVGQMVTLNVYLVYNGLNYTQAMVTPLLPAGIVANGGGQILQLYPGVAQQVSYPLSAQQGGSYWIVSDISYVEEGIPRSLRLEAPFTAIEPQVQPEPQAQPGPGEGTPPVYPGMPVDPYIPPQGGDMPGEEFPPEIGGHNQSDHPPADLPFEEFGGHRDFVGE